jgi:hypothetical protein
MLRLDSTTPKFEGTGEEPVMYTDVKTEKGTVRVHHKSMIVMYKMHGRKLWRWMQQTPDAVAHAHRKIPRAVGRAMRGRPKMRVVK